MSLEVHTVPRPDLSSLGTAWRELEARAEFEVFQGWGWVGCLAGERFPDPVLLRAERGGETVGLALFNRRGGRLHLTESGEAALDSPFVEHNAPLVARDAPEAGPALLRAAWEVPGARRLVLGGAPAWAAEAAGGGALRRQARPAPHLDLDAVRAAGGDFLATRSANARAQIRRSRRHLEERFGPLSAEEAGGEAEALDWLERMAALHGASWRRRGRPGAFAEPFMMRFHRELVRRCLARGELALTRVSGPGGVLGYLHNLRAGGRVAAYQSGLDDSDPDPRSRPGLVCHTLAIEAASARGDARYDFLGGDHRYKRSLSSGAAELWWTELARPGSLLAAYVRLRGALITRV